MKCGPLDCQNRQVVGETGPAGMGLNGGQHLGADGGGRLVGVELEHELEAALLERLTGRVLGFGDAVAVEDEEVAGFEAGGGEQPAAARAVSRTNPQILDRIMSSLLLRTTRSYTSRQ